MLKKCDRIIYITIMILIIIGLLMVMSSSFNSANYDRNSAMKQIFFIILGFAVSVLLSKIRIESIKKYSSILYILINISLVLVLFMPKTNGASSWFRFAGLSLQPSEFTKIIVILVLAKLLENTNRNFFTYLKAFLYVLLPLFLIIKQPDFGTAIVIAGIFFCMIFFSGIKYRYVIPVILLALIFIGITGYYLVNGHNLFFSEYQAERIRVFLDPSLDPYGSGYNALKAKQAVGSGMVVGMGYLKGIQNQLGNIPEKTTDFIFAVIGEELGFIGCAGIVILFGILLIRLLILARKQDTMYKKLVIIGVFTMLFIHIFINIGMNIGLVPITGIPLPFISYGGSSIFTNIIAIGLVDSLL